MPNMNNFSNQTISDTSLSETIPSLPPLHGPLRYTLTNDYMFRAVMQSSNEALKHLLSALLDISYDSIESCIINNPIELGETISDKTTIMDIKCTLNDSETFKSTLAETWRAILVSFADIFQSKSLRILAERLSQSEIGLPLRQISFNLPPIEVGVFSD